MQDPLVIDVKEIKELKEWLLRNRATLKKYEADELAMMARTNGFSLGAIWRVIPEAYADFQTNTTFPTRLWWFVEREINHIKQRSEPSLKKQWNELYQYENGKDWL